MDSSIGTTSQKKGALVRWVISASVVAASLAVTATAWASSGPLGILAQAAPSCPACPAGSGFLTGTAGYVVRWLLILALFIITAVAAFALGRSRKRAEQA